MIHSQIVILNFTGILPEPTDEHILNIFLASGITRGQVSN